MIVATWTLAALIFFWGIDIGSTSDAPYPYPAQFTGRSIIDSKTACENLKTSVPNLLASNPHSQFTAPLQLTSVIAELYTDGANPSTADLYKSIPPDALRGVTESLGSIISSVGDWTRSDVIGDYGYGLANDFQTIRGGLPSFCRFGANIVTSSKSGTWFETWLPVSNNSTTSSTSDSNNSSFISPQEPLALQKSNKNVLFPPSQVQVPIELQKLGRASPNNWRGRLVFVGSGGQRGSVSYPDMKQILTRYREAAASSNLGHFGTGAGTNWTIKNPEAQIDFSYRGTHVASLAAKVVVQTFYGVKGHSDSPAKSRRDATPNGQLASGRSPHHGFPVYYAGCSTGGRQGFAEAQHYPHDFDGIMAGSPAVYYNHLNAYQIHVNSFQNDTTSPRYIPQDLYPIIHDLILAECDTLDGIKDAVLEDPKRCSPDLSKLLCAPPFNATFSTAENFTDAIGSPIRVRENPPVITSAPSSSKGEESASGNQVGSYTSKSLQSTPEGRDNRTYAPAGRCLTYEQIENLRSIYQTYRYPNGELIHEPVEYGSETVWITTDGVVGKPFPPAPGWYQYQILNRTDKPSDFKYYEEVTFDLIRKAQKLNPAETDIDNVNLNAYFRRGSKLLHYHGTSDQLIPSGSSKRLYRQVLRSYDQGETGSPVHDNYRFFTIPGMGHCRGGDGAWNFGGASQTVSGGRPYRFDKIHDALLALMAWTERGDVPLHLYGAAYRTNESTKPDFVTKPSDEQAYKNGLKFTHRLCPYPRQAVLINATSPYDAVSQSCQEK